MYNVTLVKFESTVEFVFDDYEQAMIFVQTAICNGKYVKATIQYENRECERE